MKRLQYILLISSTLITVFLQTCKNQPVEAQTTGNSDNTGSARSDQWLRQQTQFEKQRNEMVEFIAFGEDSTWVISIGHQGAMSFMDYQKGDSMAAPASEMMLPADLNAVMYGAEVESGRLSLTIYTDSCNFSGDLGRLPYRARLLVARTNAEFNEYQGCGIYLNSPRLHDIWALKKWNRFDDLGRAFPKGKPVLELHLDKNEFYGNSGCRELRGRIEPKGGLIDFYNFSIRQEEGCRDEGPMAFEELINSIHFSLKLEARLLTLYNGDEELIFQKVD